MDGHRIISVTTYPPYKTGIPEVEDVITPVIVDTNREVVMIVEITVVIMVVIIVAQTTVTVLVGIYDQ